MHLSQMDALRVSLLPVLTRIQGSAFPEPVFGSHMGNAFTTPPSFWMCGVFF